MERDRIMKTMTRIRNTDFKNMRTKEYIKSAVPDIDISDIFRPKVEEKKVDESL
jgi:hypothetical protein